jgi:hypothetical protein
LGIYKYIEKKSQQLGINFSTATHRLHREIFFKLVQACGLDACFRCNKLIETWQELSVDHKQPWQDVSVDLFWDLNNIAFSHKFCNGSAARRKGNVESLKTQQMGKYRLAPVGMVWCGGHKEYLPMDQFYRNKRNPSGYGCYCKSCIKIYG